MKNYCGRYDMPLKNSAYFKRIEKDMVTDRHILKMLVIGFLMFIGVTALCLGVYHLQNRVADTEIIGG